MRGWILSVSAAALLAACGSDNQADDGGDLNQSLTAQNIVANDITAIDAVTGAAANMAADVDFTDALANEIGNSGSNRVGTSQRRPASPSRPAASRPQPRAEPPAPATAPATEPASNSTE